MLNDYSSEVTAALLLSLLAMVTSLGLALTYLVVRWRQKLAGQPYDSWVPQRRLVQDVETPPDRKLYTRPTTWLAIRTTSLEAVQRAFSLDDPRPCAWTDGLAADAARRLYISPPIAGWVLVAGFDLPEPSDDIDACFRFLVGLSQRLGHVQYFHGNGALQHHAWARLEAGRVLRAYAWIGHAAWNQGLPSTAERELRLRAYDYGEGEFNHYASLPDAIYRNLDRLPRLAARWSIDPAAVDARFWSAHPGISGEFSVPRLL